MRVVNKIYVEVMIFTKRIRQIFVKGNVDCQGLYSYDCIFLIYYLNL